MFNRNHVIASIREIRYSLNGITQKQWITCGTVFATVCLLSAIYILFRPGDYIESGTLCPFIITAAIYSAALSCALIRRDDHCAVPHPARAWGVLLPAPVPAV